MVEDSVDWGLEAISEVFSRSEVDGGVSVAVDEKAWQFSKVVRWSGFECVAAEANDSSRS